MANYDVLIVGCGPSGATLANILRKKGHKVAIFDRDKEIFVAPRAMTIDGESCRIFQSIDIQKRMEEYDARPYVHHIFVGEKRELLCEFRFGDREGNLGYPAAGVRFHQPALEQFLRDDFSLGTGVDPFLGYEVIEVDGTGDQARLSAKNCDTGKVTEFTGKFIIGADGGGSKTRSYLETERVDFNYSRQWIVIDILVHDDDAWNAIHDSSEFMCRPDAALVFVKGFHNHVRFDFEVTDEQARTFTKDDALKIIRSYIYVPPEKIEFQRLAPYHFYAGMPREWSKGRVFLMGDAAHLTSPFSGQGLCMGIRDAGNLGFKLDLVLSGRVDESFMDTYRAERWDHCEKIIQGASERGLMISASTPIAKFKRWLTFWIGRNLPNLAMEAMRKSSIGFRYEEGLVGEHDLAGYLMIQSTVALPEGDPILMDHIIGDGFALLTRTAEHSSDLDWFRDVLGGTVNHIGTDLIDHDGKLTEYFDEHDIDAVLIRPDRYIFDAGPKGSDLCTGLKQSLMQFAPVGAPCDAA
ncbi:MAG: FAD-dependent monooxygenase [Erythrobacter sp.]